MGAIRLLCSNVNLGRTELMPTNTVLNAVFSIPEVIETVCETPKKPHWREMALVSLQYLVLLLLLLILSSRQGCLSV